MSPFSRKGKWYPDPKTRPDKRHAGLVANALKGARDKAKMDQEAFWATINKPTDGTNEEDQRPQD